MASLAWGMPLKSQYPTPFSSCPTRACAMLSGSPNPKVAGFPVFSRSTSIPLACISIASTNRGPLISECTFCILSAHFNRFIFPSCTTLLSNSFTICLIIHNVSHIVKYILYYLSICF